MVIVAHLGVASIEYQDSLPYRELIDIWKVCVDLKLVGDKGNGGIR